MRPALDASPARLAVAALLSVIPLGLVWTVNGAAFTSVFIPTLSVVPDYTYGGTTLETGGYVLPTGGGPAVFDGAQSPVRLALVVAAVALITAGALRRGSGRRSAIRSESLVVVGVGALVVAVVLALADRASVPLLFLLAAVLTVTGPPPALRRGP